MDKIKEMNDTIFRKNLMMAVSEIIKSRNIKEENLRFKIIPIYEEKSHLMDWMTR